MNAIVKSEQHSLQAFSDQVVDMFTERGFALANRLAKAFSSSDAVPAQFRMHNLKRVKSADGGYGEEWVENPNAIGNCLVAIEVARAVNMSITAVMQNADMIEGKLRWSGKFVIAAINASGRFTPLRFQVRNLGPIKATYKEKGGWDKSANRYSFTEKTVDVDNVECIAWALPKGFSEPNFDLATMREYRGRMLDMYRDLGLPVIESAPVTMRMAVEEGWYGKSGSKWQTELRSLMFQYRAGSFFGNIHAPDIVMGMGRTTEEAIDLAQDVDGVYVPGKPEVTMPRARVHEPDPDQPQGVNIDQSTGEISEADAIPADVIEPADTPDAGQEQGAAEPAAKEPVAQKTARKASASSEPGTLATEGERKFILNRAKSAGLEVAKLMANAGVDGLPADLAGLTKDGFVAIKDLLPKGV